MLLISLTMVLICCDTKSGIEQSNSQVTIDQSSNLILGMKDENLGNFKWVNEPTRYEIIDSVLSVTVESGTDYFNDPESSDINSTAPLLYREVEGDFVATALVNPDLSSMWNATSLMVYIDSLNWIKFAFENSDATGNSIVTVVTRGVSDDANGVVIGNQGFMWLRMIRKGNIYAMHWSHDGKEYKMARLSTLPEALKVKVGLEAQSPVGTSATHEFLYFNIENKTVANLRKGQ